MDAKAVEQAADELYALPPADFTRERDERAKALRKEGQRDEADAVKALRKPTVAAWALNQLARRRAKEVERLLAAGEELRAAQEELLAGGDRKAFQSAAAKEREQVAKLAGEAAELAAEAGERASPALHEKISATLHAAALDEETAEELRAGRLVREREAIGGFGGGMAAPPARGRGPGQRRPARGDGSTDGERSGPEGARAPRSAGRAAPATEARRGRRRRERAKDGAATRAKGERKARRRGQAARRRRAREAAAEQRQRLAAARTDERHARRELDAAAKATEHAETRAEAAQSSRRGGERPGEDDRGAPEGGAPRAGGGEEGARPRGARPGRGGASARGPSPGRLVRVDRRYAQPPHGIRLVAQRSGLRVEDEAADLVAGG